MSGYTRLHGTSSSSAEEMLERLNPQCLILVEEAAYRPVFFMQSGRSHLSQYTKYRDVRVRFSESGPGPGPGPAKVSGPGSDPGPGPNSHFFSS